MKKEVKQAYFQGLLDDFKRSNKTRKEKIAKEAGYPSTDAYKVYLEKQCGITTTPKKTGKKKDVDVGKTVSDTIKDSTKNDGEATQLVTTPVPETKVAIPIIPTVHNVHILDASGSMSGSKLNNAILGINNEIEELKKDNSIKYTQTFVHFSNNYDIRIDQLLIPISQAKRVDLRARSLTALNDAIGNTLTLLQDRIPTTEKVLVKIFTDGEENDSRVWDKQKLSYLIEKLNSENYTITFVGTNNDVNKVVRDLKIDKSNTLVHDNTSRGVADSFAVSLSATRSYGQKLKEGKDVSKGFYKKTGTL